MITKRDDILSVIKAYMSQINLQHGTTTVERCKSGEISAWLTDGSQELVPETRGSIPEGTICYS